MAGIGEAGVCGQAGRHNIGVESDLRSKFQDGNVVGDSEVGIYDRKKVLMGKKVRRRAID